MPKILVPVKRVPDYETRVKLAADGKGIQSDAIKWILNPFDEIAVEEALRLKERMGDVDEIVVVSIGPESTSEQVRSALAMGADRGILVKTDEYIDSDTAHRILAEVFRRGEYKLLLMGKQAIDSDANQTGQLLAAALALPQATFASKIEIESGWSAAAVTREVDGGLETLRVALPAVVTTDLRLNEPRYRSLQGIVQAKKKPLEELTCGELGIEPAPKVKVRKMSLPSGRKAGVKVGSVAELVQKLKTEAKVL